MAITTKCTTADDIINGLATIMQGTGRPATYDNASRNQHLASGDSTRQFLTLDGRYKVSPSGWNS